MTMPVRVIPKDTTPSVHTPVADTAAIITLAAEHHVRHLVRTIVWSYSVAPTAGRLTLTVDGTIRLDVDITAAGPGALPLDLLTAEQAAVVITLAAGGAAVVGKLSVVSNPTSGSQWEQ